MAGFEFVNVTNPAEVKMHLTKIRRHVMRDIGKARRKPRAGRRSRTKDVDDVDNDSEVSPIEPAEPGFSDAAFAAAVLAAAPEPVLATLPVGAEAPRQFQDYSDSAVESPIVGSWSSEGFYSLEMGEESNLTHYGESRHASLSSSCE
jgi:hypothetical protein